MRSARQIGRTVSQWQELQQRERASNLREALAMIREARRRGDEWVVWIDRGRPAYTPDEYRALAAGRAPGRARTPIEARP